MADIKDTLAERETTHGTYLNTARYAENLCTIFQSSPNWAMMKPDAKQSLHMISVKIARILSGDPEYDDNWRDISGYATLVLERITKDAE